MSAGFGDLAAARTPKRPGPGKSPEALLKALDVEISRRMDGLMAGDHRSALAGEGTELSRIRPYVPGDDVRRIDPNTTARMGVPHVRVEVAEKALTSWIVLDTSPSMTFGTADRRKADVAEGVVLAFGHLAARGANSVGLLTFGDGYPVTLPPRGGRMGTLGLLNVLRGEPASEEVGETSPAGVFSRLSRLSRRSSLVVVVSDFRGPKDWRKPLLELAGRYEVIAVEIRDPREQDLPDVGHLSLVDPETGRQLRVDTSSRRLRERFATEAVREREELARELRSTGADHLTLSTEGDWLRKLATLLRRRGARAATHRTTKRGGTR